MLLLPNKGPGNHLALLTTHDDFMAGNCCRVFVRQTLCVEGASRTLVMWRIIAYENVNNLPVSALWSCGL